MDKAQYFRIEFVDNNRQKVSAGVVTGRLMSKLGLESSPYTSKNGKTFEHWFTKEGWKNVGEIIVKAYNDDTHSSYSYNEHSYYLDLKNDLKLKIRKRKTKPSNIKWSDNYQVMCIF